MQTDINMTLKPLKFSHHKQSYLTPKEALISNYLVCVVNTKLDGVGSVGNSPSTN